MSFLRRWLGATAAPGRRTAPRMLTRLAGRLAALLAAAPLATLTAGCSSNEVTPGHALTYTYAVPPATTFDLHKGEAVAPDALAARLAGVRLLFVGEHHTEPGSHAFERDVLETLAATGRPVAVALEMFPPAADPVLEEWRQGKLDELAFLERSEWYTRWGFAWAHYRAVFEAIRDRHLPVYGVNADTAVRKAVEADKADELPPEERALLGDLDAAVPPHERYLLDTLRDVGHGGDLRADSPTFRRFYRVQRMWDRLMGVRSARLAERQPADGITVVLLGSGHLAWGLGANLQARRESALPQLTLWDALVSPKELDAQGRYAVPLGMADWARIYVRESAPPAVPSLAGLRLEADAQGVRIKAVSRFAPPELRVFEADDVVLSLNGQAAPSPTALRLAYERVPPGQPARFTVLRKGARQDVQVTPRAEER